MAFSTPILIIPCSMLSAIRNLMTMNETNAIITANASRITAIMFTVRVEVSANPISPLQKLMSVDSLGSANFRL
ncbi:hypothetical protein D3C73_1465810 [compost metagenome]